MRQQACHCLSLLLLLSSLCIVSAGDAPVSGWLASQLPSPDSSPSTCGRPHRSSVCDPDGLLSEEDADAVDELLDAIHRGVKAGGDAGYPYAPACKSGKPRGFELAVAVVRRAGGGGSAALRAERLARGLHDSWGVGDACGSGLVLLVAVEDRQVRGRV